MARRAVSNRKLRFLCASLALGTGACGSLGTAPTTSSEPPVASAPAAPGRSPVSPASSSAALEARIDELELRLLEAHAQQLEVQTRLDDARREVVRAMAKLQSQATRAEAASGMAEAEIALQGLPPTAASQTAAEGARLMQEATAEFDEQNYGGALYLANEAKNAAAAARSQIAEQVSARPSERSFAVPLPLQTTASANVREGPGVSFAVLFVLPNGAPVTGHSAAQQWLRVTDESGRRGWISRSLIRVRP